MKDRLGFSNKRTPFFTAMPLEIMFLYVILLLVLCVISVFLITKISKNAENTYANLVSDQIYEYKTDYLKDTVENAIATFDGIQKNVQDQLNNEQSFFLEKVSELVSYSGKDSHVVTRVIQSVLLPEHLFLHISNVQSKQVFFSTIPKNVQDGNVLFTKRAIVENYLIEVSYSQSYLYAEFLSRVHSFLHSQVFSNDTYIWINEVHNWEGGDDYALRLVHPNLVETEGMLLSTKMEDIAGNFPYLEELEGIKNEGHFFNTYYFKRKNLDEVAKKLTYASLYEDYDWIVAMGVYVDDVNYHAHFITEESKRFVKKNSAKILFVLVSSFLFVLVLLIITSTYYINRAKRRLAKESNLDFLTSIYNRKIADEHLLVAFYEYKKTADNQFVFLIDIDDFKEVNDSYGHSAGDMVLKTIVEIIKNETRETDSLFRWGGEEFLLVCKYVDVADIASFTQRIIDSVKNTPITIQHPRRKKQKLLEYKKENGSDELGVFFENTVLFNETTTSLFLTISAGISCFSPKDTSYLECFKRTDAALYESKNTGKNKYTILY